MKQVSHGFEDQKKTNRGSSDQTAAQGQVPGGPGSSGRSLGALLKAELQLSSNSDFLSDAVALFRWAVSERKLGHRIVSESANGERKVLLFPRIERVAPDLSCHVSKSNGPGANWRVLLNSYPRGKRTAHGCPDSGHAGLNGHCDSPPRRTR